MRVRMSAISSALRSPEAVWTTWRAWRRRRSGVASSPSSPSSPPTMTSTSIARILPRIASGVRSLPCRMPRAAPSTMPTRMSSRPRTGSSGTPTPGCASACNRSTSPRWRRARRGSSTTPARSTPTPTTARVDAEQIMLRKNWRATGAFIADDRPRALDLLGFASQLVFNTFANKELQRAEHRGDLDYAYGLARAHNRAIVDFCSRRPSPLGGGLCASRRFRAGRGHGRRGDRPRVPRR